MKVRWLADTPFGKAGQEVEYARDTRVWMTDLVFGAEAAGFALIEEHSAEELARLVYLNRDNRQGAVTLFHEVVAAIRTHQLPGSYFPHWG